MDWKQKRCCASRSLLEPCCVDRLTSLPNELLGRILSMLPTKDVAATQVLCKRMRRHAFNCITCVVLDASPISHCIEEPRLIDRFPLFELFVDNILLKLSNSRQPLTRFILHFVGPSEISEGDHGCDGECFPILEPDRLNAWISHPLAYLGIKEIDLRFSVRNPSDIQLPPGIFACQSLEVLKLDSNLELDGSKIPSVCLPNLKLLHLDGFSIVKNDFITRLVSSCPSLEDLAIAFCFFYQLDSLSISSRSLRRLVLIVLYDNVKHDGDYQVLIDTPNLHYFHCNVKLSKQYSVTNMNVLSHARIEIYPLYWESDRDSLFHIRLISLVKMMSNVQHLSLLASCTQIMHCGGGFKDQHQTVFRNLKTLELGGNRLEVRWDIVLPEILTCSPSLETLSFPEGFFFDARDTKVEVADLEDENLETTEATPQCLQSSLKRIVIMNYFGVTREINIIKFLLRKASVLQELVIYLSSARTGFLRYDRVLLENVLKTLPRASITGSIRLQD